MHETAIWSDMSLPLTHPDAINLDVSTPLSSTTSQQSLRGDLSFKLQHQDRDRTPTGTSLEQDNTIKSSRQVKQVGDRHDNTLIGNKRDNTLVGQKGNDRLLGKDGHDRLVGSQGNDYLMGGRGRDRLIGGAGNDRLVSSRDQDIYRGGRGQDTIRFRLKHGTSSLKATSVVKDFEDGKDILDLGRIRFEDLQITQAPTKSGKKSHTLLQHQPTGKYLFILNNVAPDQITLEDLQGNHASPPNYNPLNPTSSPVSPTPSLGSSVPSPSPLLPLSSPSPESPIPSPSSGAPVPRPSPISPVPRPSPISPIPSPSSGVPVPSPSSGAPNPTLAFASPVPNQSQYNVIVGTNGDDRPIEGTNGDDWIEGLEGGDRLEGGEGDDFHFGGIGKDIHLTGSGNDIIFLRKGDGHQTTYNADVVKDFEDGKDRIQLQGIRYSDLNLVVGVGKQAQDTLIRNYATKQILLVIKFTDPADITLDDFILDPELEAIHPPKEWISDTRQISPFHTAFHNIDTSDEERVKTMGGATVTIGTQRLYIGYRQVSSTNQDPIILSFDDADPRNNWERTDYEVTNADSKGYGLFWSGTDLYAVFSVDGTQGTPTEDYRRVSADASTPWLRTYGQGGGAKVTIVGRIDLTTGDLLDAAYISSVLQDKKSNTLAVTDLSLNDQDNLLVRADARFYPRNVDGSPMVNVGDTPAPFDYTVELTPDLKRVISASAVGIQ